MPKAVTAETLLNEYVSRSDCILLVNPPVEETRYAWLRWNQPLDLLKIGTYLQRHVGCNVELLDFMKADARGKVMQQRLPGARQYRIIGDERYPMRRYGLPYSELTKWVVKQRAAGTELPTQVWITSLCSYWFQSVAQVCREVRQALPDAQIVLIGSYARLMPGHAANTCPADLIATEAFDVADIPAALDLYQNGLPPFAALRLNPKTAITEIKVAIEKEIHDFAFFEEDICIDDGEPLIEIVRKTEHLHLHMRFHVICGLDPWKVTPKLATILAKRCFANLHFEEASDGEQLATEAYRRAVAYLREAGAKIPAKLVSGFVWIGRPEENLDAIIARSFKVLELLGSFIFKPFSPTPGSAEHRRYADYLGAIPHQDWSPHVFPFSELNEIPRAEYNDLYRMAAFLNDRVRGEAFDFLEGTMGLKFLKESLRREVWKLEPSSLSVVD
jgi:hypothetical protein